MTTPVIHWFRNDLRLGDNPALSAAAEAAEAVLPVYIHDPASAGRWPTGGASSWWRHHSLEQLGQSLAARGSRLVMRVGDSAGVLANLVRETGSSMVTCSRGYEPADIEVEARARERLSGMAELAVAPGRLLFEPEAIRTKSGTPFQVFGAFWRACLAAAAPGEPLTVPALPAPSSFPPGVALDTLGLLPCKPDWSAGLQTTWRPGETAALQSLGTFLDGAARAYRRQRDLPGVMGTSRLSPHLHFGEISARQVWHAMQGAAATGLVPCPEADAFLRELGWREFSAHLLYRHADLPERPLRREFEHFPWASDDSLLQAWQRGQTGYPIVDAGMRELWSTGWMHNRVRMIVASFLVKDLLIPWQAGEAWFRDTLVDADLASNAASWQWVAGCGTDAAPFFRIFNPVLQGRKFDPRGAYVRRWVPELAALPDKFLHSPWNAVADVPSTATGKRDPAYPAPVVDHRIARERALEAYAVIRAGR